MRLAEHLMELFRHRGTLVVAGMVLACLLLTRAGAALTSHEAYVAEYPQLRSHDPIGLAELQRAFLAEADSYIKEHPDGPEIEQAKLNKALLAKGLYGERQDNESDALLRRIVADHASSPLAAEAMYYRARLLWSGFDGRRAAEGRAVAFDLVKRYPRSAKAPLALVGVARNYIEAAGDTAAAVAVLERVLEDYPETPGALEARKELIALACDRGQEEQVQVHVSALLDRFRRSPDQVDASTWAALLLDGACYACRRTQNWRLGTRVCEAVSGAYPDSYSWLARCELARLAEAQGRRAEARAIYTEIADRWLGAEDPHSEPIAQAIARSLSGLCELDHRFDIDRVVLLLDTYGSYGSTLHLVRGAAVNLFDNGDPDGAVALNERLLDVPGRPALCRYLYNIHALWSGTRAIQSWNRSRTSALLEELLRDARYWPSARKTKLRWHMVTWHRVESVFGDVAALRAYFEANGDQTRSEMAALLAVHAALEKRDGGRAERLARQLLNSDPPSEIADDAQLLLLLARFEEEADDTEAVLAEAVQQRLDDPDEKALIHALLGIRACREFRLSAAAKHFGAAKSSARHNAYLVELSQRYLDAIAAIEEAGRTSELSIPEDEDRKESQ